MNININRYKFFKTKSDIKLSVHNYSCLPCNYSFLMLILFETNIKSCFLNSPDDYFAYAFGSANYENY